MLPQLSTLKINMMRAQELGECRWKQKMGSGHLNRKDSLINLQIVQMLSIARKTWPEGILNNNNPILNLKLMVKRKPIWSSTPFPVWKKYKSPQRAPKSSPASRRKSKKQQMTREDSKNKCPISKGYTAYRRCTYLITTITKPTPSFETL